MLERVADVERAVEKSLALDDETRAFLDDEFGPNVCDFNLEGTFNLDRVRSLYSMYKDDLTRSAMEEAGNRRYTSKKMYYVSRRIELLCRIFSCSPRQILSALEEAGAVNEDEVRDFARRGVSWAIGYAFGRWGLPKANKKQRPSPDSFFQSLPHTPPAALIEINGAAFTILADDANVAHDIIRNIKTSFAAAWPSAHSGLLRNATSILNSSGEDDTYLRDWLRRNFFDEHLMEYTKSRRKAPIYWQLATPSTSYSVWLYYHRFTKDTFFKVLNEYVKPKLEHERQKLDRLRGEAGAEPTRSQRKDIEGQEKFVAELASMVEEVERIAPLWNPNLNDGVIINFAPSGDSCHKTSRGKRNASRSGTNWSPVITTGRVWPCTSGPNESSPNVSPTPASPSPMASKKPSGPKTTATASNHSKHPPAAGSQSSTNSSQNEVAQR